MHRARWIGGALSLALAALFALAFEARYWRWRDCFNELGRCWDSATQQVYLEQAGIFWGGATGVFLVLALVLLAPRLAATLKRQIWQRGQ